MAAGSGSLVSRKAAESGSQVLLHPLALLCISEHITRHAARERPGPIVGLLMGHQDGRVISIVNATDCCVRTDVANPRIDHHWLRTRLNQYKEVYTNPHIELIGWYTVSPTSGPTKEVLPIHKRLLNSYNPNAVLLTFHPSEVVDKTNQMIGKLPITIYESVWEDISTKSASKEASTGSQAAAKVQLRFKTLPYSIESSDTELIALNTLSKGGDSTGLAHSSDEFGSTQRSSSVPKVRPTLYPEEEDMISLLNTRLNAVHTLNARLAVIRAYLRSILEQTCCEVHRPNQESTLSRPILRQISSLLSNLSLVKPDDEPGSAQAKSLLQNYDAEMIELLGQLCENVSTLRDTGRRLALYSKERRAMTGIRPLARGKQQPQGSRLGTIDSYAVDLSS